jgi:hypothetical protein
MRGGACPGKDAKGPESGTAAAAAVIPSASLKVNSVKGLGAVVVPSPSITLSAALWEPERSSKAQLSSCRDQL